MTTAAPPTHRPADPTDRAVAAPGARQVALALVALATGGFAIGTTEFVTMGLLPDIAAGIDRSIPATGHVISAYALGVVVGAPLIAVGGARLPRKGLLLALMATFVVGNVASALAGGYGLLASARFFAGLPHGAYFGVASLVAASLVDRGPPRTGREHGDARAVGGHHRRRARGTWMGQHLGWRSAYWAVSALGVLTVALVWWLVPATPADRSAHRPARAPGVREPQVWLTRLIGGVGFGGMFAMYSYVAPAVTDVTGLDQSTVPLFLLAFGLGTSSARPGRPARRLVGAALDGRRLGGDGPGAGAVHGDRPRGRPGGADRVRRRHPRARCW